MEVVEALKEGNSTSIASAFFYDCYFMSIDFTHVIYDHCFRESNLVAHELARLAKLSPFKLWMDSAPSAIIPILVYDATILTHEYRRRLL